MPTIVMTTWRRPEYTKRVFSAINECIGIEKYNIAVFAEPDANVVEVANNWKPNCKKYNLHVNPQRLGCGPNIYQALESGFKTDDYVIMVEDDIVLAKDALLYFEHCKQEYKNDNSVFTVCGYAKNKPDRNLNHTIQKVSWFTPWGWATWSNRWQEMQASKDKLSNIKPEELSWDIVTNHQIRNKRFQIEPFLSRTQNIGAELGAYCPSKKWHEENCFNEYGSWSVDLDSSKPFVDIEDM
jgi:GNT-I family